VIGVCGTVHEAIVQIHATKPDLLLLDIGLPDGTGFDILDNKPTQAKVIFMTAHNDYASRAFRYSAIDYLLKPINENELREALQKVIKAHPLLREQIDIAQDSFRKKKEPDYIVLQSQQFDEVAEVKEICYIQGENGCTIVFLNGGKKVVTTKILKYYEELLPSAFFLRTHQSYLVNKFYIQRHHRRKGILSLKDGTEIPVSLRKKEMINLHFKTL
jgi:two-component system LytT family response regulator